MIGFSSSLEGDVDCRSSGVGVGRTVARVSVALCASGALGVVNVPPRGVAGIAG